MTALTWEFDKGDVKRLRDRIDKMRTELDGPHINTFLRKEVHPHIRTRVYERFRNQGDEAVGGPWEVLQEATLHWRRFFIARDGLRIRPHEPINVRTGRLRTFVARSFDATTTGPASAELVQPSKRETTPHIFRKLKRAQQGDYRTFARPVIALDETDQRAIETITHDWVERIMRVR